MLSFFRPRREPEHKVGAFSDLMAFFQSRPKHSWAWLLLSIAMPALLIAGFFADSVEQEYRDPDVVFFEYWAPDRTIEDTRKRLAKDEPVERAAIAAAEAERKRVQAEFRKIADQMGIEVDEPKK